MIIDPDFLDNYKVKSLCIDLGTDLAPFYLIRLWGYCQKQKQWLFEDMTPKKLRRVCQAAGDSDEFFEIMEECRIH